MDIMRSAYRCKMRFYKDRPDLVSDVQWYFADDNAPPLGVPHHFGSRTWDVSEGGESDLGELLSPRSWRGGLPAVPATLGNGCGTPRQWAQGVELPLPPEPPGPSPCCPPAGMAIGGSFQGNIDGRTACAEAPPDLTTILAHVVSCDAGSALAPGDNLLLYEVDYHCFTAAPFTRTWVSDTFACGLYSGRLCLQCDPENVYTPRLYLTNSSCDLPGDFPNRDLFSWRPFLAIFSGHAEIDPSCALYNAVVELTPA